MPNYFIVDDFTAPKKTPEENGDKLQRLFRKGEFIAGSPRGYAKYKGEPVHMVEQSDGYLIPAKFLKQVDTEYGDTGEQAQKVQSFARKLPRSSGLPIVYEDERLTTISAIRTLTLQGVKTGHNKELVDRQSAAIILQKFLDQSEPPSTA